MARDIRWLNELDDAAAAQEIERCCAAPAWVSAVVERRPYADRDALLAAANDAWIDVGSASWRRAIAHHPRIGEASDDEKFASTRAWSSEEQAGVSRAGEGQQEALAALQREYEKKFGHIFLICATGLTAAEIATAISRRMENDPETELGVAAEELRRIMNLRLEKLIDGEPDHDARP